jgi:hypothetical protein
MRVQAGMGTKAITSDQSKPLKLAGSEFVSFSILSYLVRSQYSLINQPLHSKSNHFQEINMLPLTPKIEWIKSSVER